MECKTGLEGRVVAVATGARIPLRNPLKATVSRVIGPQATMIHLLCIAIIQLLLHTDKKVSDMRYMHHSSHA